jgi:hypothetical protein
MERIPGKVSGAWLFKNTRVPVKALFENIEGGATIQEFLEWFPGAAESQLRRRRGVFQTLHLCDKTCRARRWKNRNGLSLSLAPQRFSRTLIVSTCFRDDRFHIEWFCGTTAETVLDRGA